MQELRDRLVVASPSLSMEGLDKGGLGIRKIACAVEASGMMAALDTVEALPGRKAAVDACSSEGSVAVLTWSGVTDGEMEVRAFTTLGPKVDACVLAALEGAVSPVEGTCAASVLFGGREGAEAAAEALRDETAH